MSAMVETNKQIIKWTKCYLFYSFFCVSLQQTSTQEVWSWDPSELIPCKTITVKHFFRAQFPAPECVKLLKVFHEIYSIIHAKENKNNVFVNQGLAYDNIYTFNCILNRSDWVTAISSNVSIYVCYPVQWSSFKLPQSCQITLLK